MPDRWGSEGSRLVDGQLPLTQGGERAGAAAGQGFGSAQALGHGGGYGQEQEGRGGGSGAAPDGQLRVVGTWVWEVGRGHGADSGSRPFVERDSWLNAADRHGRTPLFTAVRYNRLEFVEGLVSLGADPWACDRTTRGTALHLAALLGHAPLVAALLRSPVVGPSPSVALHDAQDMYGFTPLHYAAAAGHADVARVLLDAGASYTAASQLLYDPSPGLRRLASISGIAGRAGLGFGGLGGGGGGDENRSGALSAPCAPRSNPLHLAALRGDAAVAMLVLQQYLADTDGLPRVARERMMDPRTQLNKDGFQPYMLAGNAGHWHVAQLLIPHSRDDRHHLSRNRDRDFLAFFPLPDPAAAAAAAASGGGGGEGPPSLSELAGRVWAAKLLTDVKSAEAAVRQLQHSQSYNSLTAHPRDAVRGAGGGVLGALLRRAAGGSPPAAAAAALGGNGSRRGLTSATSSSSMAAAAAGTAAAAAAAPAVAAGGAAASGSYCWLVPAGSSPGGSTSSTPRTSASGGACGLGVGIGGGAGGGGSCRGVSPSGRTLPLLDSRRTASLDLAPRSPRSSQSQQHAAAAGPPPSPTPSPPATAAATAPGSPVVPATALAGAAAPALCDVCFEQPQEVSLRPCPHRMCAGCCKRVVEMHCAAAGVRPTGRAPGRPAAVPPRCPFCQATIRGFVPAPAAAAPASVIRQ
ncbi:hypothetical protein PLESTM_000974900 [Pleodorina starrii]|nr:hypothetical protein PLESTM_000974900 [Pleodorina starrii]